MMQQSGSNNLSRWNSIALMVIVAAGLFFYTRASRSALVMAAELRQIGRASIQHTVVIKDTIPLYADVRIPGETGIGLRMNLEHSLPIDFMQRIQDSIQVPVRLQISEVLHVDTSLFLPEQLELFAEGNIPVDQKFALLGMPRLKVGTRADIPLAETLQVKLAKATRFTSHIPIRLNINKDLPLALDLHVPIRQVLPIKIPIRSQAKVSFPESLKIVGYIPIELEVPVHIPLAETPLKTHLDRAAEHLEDMFLF